MSIIRNGIQLATTGTVDYEQLSNKPSINGTILSGNVTIDATNILTVTSLPTSGIDTTKLYKVGNTLNWYNGSAWVDVTTQPTTYSDGTGITIDGDGTINHSNSVTSATVGSTTSIPQITFDSEGHITSAAGQTVYPPTTVGTSGQYWKSQGSGKGVWQSSGLVAESNANLVTGGTVWQYLQDNASSVDITLNDTATTSPSFYAPTASGDSGAMLISKGASVAPTYATNIKADDASSTSADSDAYATITLGNATAKSSTDAHSEGRIVLNSSSTKSHKLTGAATSTDISNVLPNANGLLVSTGKTDGSAIGSSNTPCYINGTGTAVACDYPLRQILSGTTDPDSTLGNDGDIYIKYS